MQENPLSPGPRKPPLFEKAAPAMRLMGLGWYFALVLVGGIVGGLLLDNWLATKPVFTLMGLFGGLFLAFWGGYFLLMEAIGKGRGSKKQ